MEKAVWYYIQNRELVRFPQPLEGGGAEESKGGG